MTFSGRFLPLFFVSVYENIWRVFVFLAELFGRLEIIDYFCSVIRVEIPF